MWYLSVWQLGLKLECICWTGKGSTNTFLRSTGIIQVLYELPTNKRHFKVPQDRLLWPTNVDKRKNRFLKKSLLKCVTRPDLGGVPLIIYIFKSIFQHSSGVFLLTFWECDWCKKILVRNKTIWYLLLSVHYILAFFQNWLSWLYFYILNE